MKRRLLSLLLVLVMLLGSCVLCFTGCTAPEEEGKEENKNVNVATTLVMWCVTEEGTNDAQAQAVAQAMSDLTQSQFKTKLLVKYLTMDEYYEKLEAAMTQLEADRGAEKTKPTIPSTPGADATTSEQTGNKKGEVMLDENGDPIIDTTVYPDVKDYQVDILYISGYDKYTQYVAKKWLSSLNAELSGSSKEINSYVPSALLGAVRHNGTTYAIPNNNVIGEYTYMLVDKQLYDKYYYTAEADDLHSVVDLADFLEDIVTYEKDVLPINGDVNYCMSLIANYWDIDPATLKVTGDFSVVGYAYKDTDKINRGDIVLKFDSLLTDATYRNALTNLMDFKFKGYFGTAAEGQRSAVSFVKGDAATATQYEDDYYVVVVDYPRASNEDLYENMFAVSAFTSSLSKSMQIVTWLNTNAQFRNLFQYGIENVNYTLNSDGTVSMLRSNGYHMDLSKTGNEFIAYVPEGTNVKVWEYAKQQNREAMIDPLLGFSMSSELIDQSEALATDKDQEDEYVIETLDVELLTYLSELSDRVWADIQACENTEELAVLLDQLSVDLAVAKDENIRRAAVYTMVEPEFDLEGNIATNADGEPTVADPTVKVDCEVRARTVIKNGKERQEFYFVKTRHLTPYQVYYRWMNEYGFCPKNFS